jgi:hypothetical protein
MTGDAYLTVLAASLGTSYEPLDRISRADCPLDDDQLIQAAAGLLPLREASGITWIIAPRCLTARRLASHPPRWLQPFRLTSSERLLGFVTRHTQKALGRRAADGLRRSRPLFSNAPRRHGAKRITVLGSCCSRSLFIACGPLRRSKPWRRCCARSSWARPACAS